MKKTEEEKLVNYLNKKIPELSCTVGCEQKGSIYGKVEFHFDGLISVDKKLKSKFTLNLNAKSYEEKLVFRIILSLDVAIENKLLSAKEIKEVMSRCSRMLLLHRIMLEDEERFAKIKEDTLIKIHQKMDKTFHGEMEACLPSYVQKKQLVEIIILIWDSVRAGRIDEEITI